MKWRDAIRFIAYLALFGLLDAITKSSVRLGRRPSGQSRACWLHNNHRGREGGTRMSDISDNMDATGCYRLLSVLLCEPQPQEEPA